MELEDEARRMVRAQHRYERLATYSERMLTVLRRLVDPAAYLTADDIDTARVLLAEMDGEFPPRPQPTSPYSPPSNSAGS